VGTLSTALMIAAISVSVSAVTQRSRDAILTAYMLSQLWLFAPFFLDVMVRNTWAAAVPWLSPLTRVLTGSSPMGLIGAPGMPGLSADFNTRFAWMVGLQFSATALLIGLATLRLRPSFRNEGGTRGSKGRSPRSSSPFRLWRRPPCGDDPMLWKERYGGRMSRLSLGATVTLGLAMLAGLGWGVYETIGPAVEELLTYGYGFSGDNDGVNSFNGLVRGFSVVF